jgi:hypothetical protein
MTQTMSRPEVRVFNEIDPSTVVVHVLDPFDGFIFATTVAGIDEVLATDPSLVILTADNSAIYER